MTDNKNIPHELNTPPEVLAPAGDTESFYAAINAGADAVYLGLSDFNARIKAENFTKENIGEIVKYAHVYGVKVYVTVNILISDSEKDEFISVIKACTDASVDAFIIQDLGMAVLIKSLFPAAVLHASTQAGVSNLEGAKVFENLGFTRVVLARETKLEDIKAIKENTNLEIEYFVQGALCVSYSGNCYMSSLKCGMSGNRGKCRQLCRLNYTAFNNNDDKNSIKIPIKSGHLLSTNDLCLIKSLKTLYESGVTSFKIEGRLKRPAYVAKAVSVYKKAITKNLTSDEADNEIKGLSKIFSRGKYNENAYLYDNDNIIDVINQTHNGEKIGTVVKKEKFKALFRLTLSVSSPINQNDGLKFFRILNNTLTEVASIGAGNVNKNGNFTEIFTTSGNIKEGDFVYKTSDSKYESSVLFEKRRIPLKVKADFYSGSLPVLTLESGNFTITLTGEEPLEKAKNSPLTEDELRAKFKLTDTPFYLKNLTLNTDGVFIRSAILNELRRNSVSILIGKITFRPVQKYDLSAKFPYQGITRKENVKFALITENELDLFLSRDDKNEYTVVFQPTCYAETVLNSFINKIKANGFTEYFLYLPVLLTGEEIIKIDELLSFSDKEIKTGIVANNYYGFKYLKKRPTIAGIGLNAYNSFTVATLYNFGFDYVIKSIESRENLKGTYSYGGNPPLMTFAHCPYKVAAGSKCDKCLYDGKLYYSDDKRNVYKIRRYKVNYCYFELIAENDPITIINGEDFIDLRK